MIIHPCPEVPHPGRHHRFNVTVTDPLLGEVTRAYVLHLPAMFDTTNMEPTPLMMVWTGECLLSRNKTK